MEAVKDLDLQVKEPTLQELREEIKTLQSEIHLLQRQQSSRRGPEGPRGEHGQDGRHGVDGRDGSTITKAEATEIIRDLVQHDESFNDAIVNRLWERFKQEWHERFGEPQS